jgi:hypothetical protein
MKRLIVLAIVMGGLFIALDSSAEARGLFRRHRCGRGGCGATACSTGACH